MATITSTGASVFNYGMYPFTGLVAGSFGATSSPNPPTGCTMDNTVTLCSDDSYSAKLTLATSAVCTFGRLSARNNATGLPADWAVDSATFEWFDRFDVFPAANSEEFALLADSAGANPKVSLRINSSGQIQFHDNAAIASNTPTATSTTVLAAGSSYFFQWTTKTSASATGNLLIYSWDKTNQVAVLLETLACTGDWLSTQQTKRLWLTKFNNRNSQGYTRYTGKCWGFSDGSGFRGPLLRCKKLLVRAQGTDNSSLCIASAGDKPSCIDEALPDVSDYVNSLTSVNSEADCYITQTCAAAGIPSNATIVGIGPTALYWVGATAALIAPHIRIGSDTTALTALNPGTDIGVHARGPVWLTDPVLTGAWTQAGINNVQIGWITGTDDSIDNRRLGWAGTFVWYTEATASPTLVKDAHINSVAASAAKNFGANVSVFLSASADGLTARRVLLDFGNLITGASAIPSNATITTAILTANCTAVTGTPSARTFGASRVTNTAWTEGTGTVASPSTADGASWTNYNNAGSLAWGTAGGDYSASGATSGLTMPTAAGVVNWNIYATVQACINNGGECNIELALASDTSAGTAASATFDSNQGSTPFTLAITFTTPVAGKPNLLMLIG